MALTTVRTHAKSFAISRLQRRRRRHGARRRRGSRCRRRRRRSSGSRMYTHTVRTALLGRLDERSPQHITCCMGSVYMWVLYMYTEYYRSVCSLSNTLRHRRRRRRRTASAALATATIKPARDVVAVVVVCARNDDDAVRALFRDWPQ